jgi:hypothetical protein
MIEAAILHISQLFEEALDAHNKDSNIYREENTQNFS